MRLNTGVVLLAVLLVVGAMRGHIRHQVYTAEKSHESSWAGAQCDQKCADAGGVACGVYFKDCCKSADHCVGKVWKECEEGSVLPLECAAQPAIFTTVQNFIKTGGRSTKPKENTSE